jgi:hypothetical protein
MEQTLALSLGERVYYSAGLDESVHGEHLVEVAASKKPSVDEAPVEEAVVDDVNERPLADEPISVGRTYPSHQPCSEEEA